MESVDLPPFLGALFVILVLSGLVGWIPEHIARHYRLKRARKEVQ